MSYCRNILVGSISVQPSPPAGAPPSVPVPGPTVPPCEPCASVTPVDTAGILAAGTLSGVLATATVPLTNPSVYRPPYEKNHETTLAISVNATLNDPTVVDAASTQVVAEALVQVSATQNLVLATSTPFTLPADGLTTPIVWNQSVLVDDRRGVIVQIRYYNTTVPQTASYVAPVSTNNYSLSYTRCQSS